MPKLVLEYAFLFYGHYKPGLLPEQACICVILSIYISFYATYIQDTRISPLRIVLML